jgi:hypothetical protein
MKARARLASNRHRLDSEADGMTPLGNRPVGLYLTWLALFVAAVDGVLTARYSVTFVALGTVVLTMAPLYAGRLFHIELPGGFISAIAVFLYASLFLGEVDRFYEKYWWWDIALHGGAALGFGLIGGMIMLVLVKSEKLLSSAFIAAVFAFSFSVMIGAVWEIFEFGMDRTFGLNMQKSGLVDTMWDLIVDCLGAAAGATAGWAYLKGYRTIPLAATILDFVRKNPKLFKREPAPQRDADKAPGLSSGPQTAPASLGPAEQAGDASAQAGRMDPRV